MDIRFSGQNLKITDGMKEHLADRLPKFEKYAPRLVEAHVFLKKEKYIFKAEITLSAKNFHAFGVGEAKDNIFAAMDEAYARVEKQLKKFRAKAKDHHKKNLKGSAKVARALGMIETETVLPEGHPKIVRSSAFAAKPMSVEEASLQLEISPQSFLVFMNQNTETINVIHKLKDGNHGLIEPGF
ncbi:MAG TPA: ribosome-associated translation inhibitor RaiA [Candidatus Omnitrophota bacterium]|nr:ribosome-associated translation inhibitor RaiA [Candidatus Omnitrophota bacterium]HRY85238.1 ribosome-associated translation inhibitor RaiA [Candidatus Omnitrophota bacterium]